MEEEEGYDVCGNCEFWSLLWDGAADQSKWLGVCRLRRQEWRRRFVREHNGFEPTDLDMDDFIYEGMTDAITVGCRDFEEAS